MYNVRFEGKNCLATGQIRSHKAFLVLENEMRHRSWQNRSEEEMTRDLEEYMKRHPCILDQASGFLRRNAWLYQVCILSTTTIAAFINYSYALSLPFSLFQIACWSVVLLLDYLTYGLLCTHPPSLASSSLECDEDATKNSYCDFCESWRPPRASHCRDCDKCVLARDHHCPWIGQCVGDGNLHNFLLYLIYTACLCCCGINLTLSHFFSIPLSSLTLCLLSFSICVFGLCTSSFLLFRTVILVSRNFTKVEMKRMLSTKHEPQNIELGVLPVEARAPTEKQGGGLAPRLPASPPVVIEPSLSLYLYSEPSPFSKDWKSNFRERLQYSGNMEGVTGTLSFFFWFVVPEFH